MKKKRVLILSPHTDDAELGAGGTILKYLEQKKEIFWVVFSTAEKSLPKNLPKDTLKREFLEVANKLNLKEKQYLIKNFEVRNLDRKRQEILELLIKIRKDFNPDLVIGPSINDYHQDHIVVATEMIRAFKTCSSIISYELPWNNVTFNTQFFEKITSDQISKKIEILGSYKSQMIKNRSYFNKDFIMGFARTRGVQVNSEFAESFEVIRWLNE